MLAGIAACRLCLRPSAETAARGMINIHEERFVRRSREMTLSFPPFTKAVTWLLAINTGIFLLLELLVRIQPDFVRFVRDTFALQPVGVMHGLIWQPITYAFIHFEFWHWFGNMIGIWMFGAAFEGSWGSRRFLELFGFGVIGAALVTIVMSYVHILADPEVRTVGASGGVFAILMAFGFVFGENEIMLIPFPFTIKAKYFVTILVVVTLALALAGGGTTAYVAHLGGLLFGYLYVKFVPAKGLNIGTSLSERVYGIRNDYYRWKRRRAARKFEVYMRKHGETPGRFDEFGNYIPPDEKKGNGKSGWVN